MTAGRISGRAGLTVLLTCAVGGAQACGSSHESDAGYSGGGGSTVGGGGSGGTAAHGAVGGYAAVGGLAGDAASDADTKPKLGPPYPIVLAHGFFGFEKFAGLDAITYFYEVKDELAKNGETVVYTPAVDPFNDSTYRGAELQAAIEKILADTGYEKVNIIGHSQGGLDARVVAHDRPDLVASVTTIATPHQGTPLADAITGLVSDPGTQDVVDWLVKKLGYALWDAAGEKTSLWKPLDLFAKPGIDAFNQKYTDRASVIYYSLTGRSGWKLTEPECKPAKSVPFIDKWNLETDPLDALLVASGTYLNGGLDQYGNDGLVRVKDAKWGTFLGCVPADHLDEIGQLFGDGPGLGNSFDHKELYVELVKFLRAQGL